MPGAPSTAVLTTPDARQQEMYVCLVANDTVPGTMPVPVEIEVGAVRAPGTTAAALTVESVALPIAIQPGQVLVFKDETGSYLYEVTTLTESGATTAITGIAREGIPDEAVAIFPSRFELATSLDTSETTATTTFQTFDHDGISEVARGEGSQSITTGAGASYYNAGLETLIFAQRNGQDVLFLIEQPNPDSDAFDSPPFEWGVGVVNDVSKSGGVNDKSTRSVGISIKGGIRSVKPVLAD
jgi:hypothetical protein